VHLERYFSRRARTWHELSQLLIKVESDGIKRLSEQELVRFIKAYRQASSDLNYLQTHYPESKYAIYLNDLLGRCHIHIHIKDENIFHKVKFFFVNAFPFLIQREKFLFFLSTAIFLSAFVLAFLSVYYEAPWSHELLPPEQRSLLEERAAEIEEGKPVIPAAAQPLFTSEIITNNLQVSFFAFAGGFFFGLGTVYVLIVNGLLLGAFAAVYALQGESVLFWALILPHGITELVAIFMVAAAGLMLGRALLLPGDYTRLDALRLDGRSAGLILLGTVPLFLVAAVIEGLITPSAISSFYKLTFSGITALLLLAYFLPRRN